MAVQMMSVVRTLRRKANSTTMTSIAPHSTTLRTALIERSTKIAESIRVESRTAGISVLTRSISERTARATSTVLRPDCLLIIIWTAVRPLMRISSSWSSVPSLTSAMSRMYTGTPPRVMTTTLRMSSRFANCPGLRSR